MDSFGQSQCGEGPGKNFFADTEVAQGADNHVARNPGKAVEVKNSHGIFGGGT
jgi:hypothetical protein